MIVYGKMRILITISLSAYTLDFFVVGFALPGGLHFITPKVRTNPTKNKCKLVWFRESREYDNDDNVGKIMS